MTFQVYILVPTFLKSQLCSNFLRSKSIFIEYINVIGPHHNLDSLRVSLDKKTHKLIMIDLSKDSRLTKHRFLYQVIDKKVVVFLIQNDLTPSVEMTAEQNVLQLFFFVKFLPVNTI